MVDPADLAKMQIGDIARLSDLLKEPAEKVRLLGQYQNKLQETEPLSQQINAHLEAIGLDLLDNDFALAFVNGDKVSVQRLNRVSTWHP